MKLIQNLYDSREEAIKQLIIPKYPEDEREEDIKQLEATGDIDWDVPCYSRFGSVFGMLGGIGDDNLSNIEEALNTKFGSGWKDYKIEEIIILNRVGGRGRIYGYKFDNGKQAWFTYAELFNVNGDDFPVIYGWELYNVKEVSKFFRMMFNKGVEYNDDGVVTKVPAVFTATPEC